MYGFLFRYFLLIGLGLGNLIIFYVIFTPLTVYPVSWIAQLIDSNSVLLQGNTIFFLGEYAQIVDACVAGAAYYLLLILNLSTPMKLKKRLKSLGFLLLVFLGLNIARIDIFLVLLGRGFEYFDYTHRFVWYFGSTIMVVILWFINVWTFRIKEIPVYTDVKKIIEDLTK